MVTDELTDNINNGDSGYNDVSASNVLSPELIKQKTQSELKLNKEKVESEIRLANRKMKLEELKITHQIDLENRAATLKESEVARANRIIDSMESENWMKAYWRPVAGWTYLLICVADFIVFPILSMILPILSKALLSAQIAYTVWQPITLSGGGLVHVSFGAILGVTAWTRSTEKNATTAAATTK